MLHSLYNYCCVIIDLSYKTKRCNMYIQEVLQYMIKNKFNDVATFRHRTTTFSLGNR
jgi:hypothetical protein